VGNLGGLSSVRNDLCRDQIECVIGETMKIHFVDQSTLPQGLHADALVGYKYTPYAVEEMEIVPRKDDTVILHGRREPIAFPKEFHTVWAVYFYVEHGIDKIVSVGYRHVL